MKKHATKPIWILFLIFPFLFAGCTKEADNAASDSLELDEPERGGLEMARATDEWAEEILESGNITEGEQWAKRYPKSSVGVDEDGNDLLLAPIIADLKGAGATRVVVESAKLGQAEFLISMVVVLPDDNAARDEVFVREPYLSLLCQQTEMRDVGQKYLVYSFD